MQPCVGFAGKHPILKRQERLWSKLWSLAHRAADIVTSVRAMFKKDASEKLPVDVNRLILAVLAIVRIDIQKNGVEVRTQFDERTFPH